MLKGIPVLRDLPPFNKVPPFRGLANVRHLDFPAADEARLAAVCGAGKATFITPNHPEFFTDWMIDKEIICAGQPARRIVGHARRRQRPRPARAEILAGQQSDRPDPRQQRAGTRTFGRLGARGSWRAPASRRRRRLAQRLCRAADARRRRDGAGSAGAQAARPIRNSRPGSRRSSGSSPSRRMSSSRCLPNAPMSSGG